MLSDHHIKDKEAKQEHLQMTDEPKLGMTPALPSSKTADNNRGKISGCTLADIRKRPGVMLLVNTNTGYMDMTLNLLESVKRTGVCVNTTIVAEEEKAYQTMLSHAHGDPAIKVVKTDQGLGEADPGKLVLFNREHMRLVNRRHRYILSLLEKGYEVFFTDVDTFWFRDPFSYFQGKFDMAFVDERSPYPTRLRRKSLHCPSLGYFWPTNRTLQFVRKWIQILVDPKNQISDQGVLNRMMHANIPVHVVVRQLPVKYFPHALVFYNPDWRQENKDPIIMYNMGIKGHDAKAEKFKENNMWLINNTSGTG
ncbi:UDP-D-xylose:L-fucose alpha-1,3-D-xylosyltransferase 3-like [Acanthaster planci]|uniref:UDP-D-xylose:L-fucose alpha-1,3-D-xylosyltransferase 3-like n=1 Tax=Acanthaster planci TaxID=133434 RepID=A0A8B7ZRA3_ACAPL|nr:UDP-D-xylose:L-fucose alpha-1,3-D-xylosyltransferase 3-like [Acanthaster planci]